jgi:hypothetical protein
VNAVREELRWAGVCVLGAVSGCATTTVRGGYCAPPTIVSSFEPDPPPADAAPREEHVAALVGLSGVTAQQVSRSIETRVHVIERMELASSVVGAVSAELDCEGERAEQAGDYLARTQAGSVQGFTVASVVAATLTGIAGVFLSTGGASAPAQETTAISGGTATAALGLASLYVHPRATFEHPRNLLADVWLGPSTSTTFPPLIWAYFTRPVFSNSGREPIRARIVARWRRFRQVDDPETASVLFGRGGSYDADTLRLRGAMFDEVEAEVELARQDLAALSTTLLR